MQFLSLPINSSLQNNPRYQFSLKSENIEILQILSVAIFKMAAIRMQFSSLPINSSLQNNPREHWNFADFVGGHSLAIFFCQNIPPTLLNIYAKSCGNPFGGFRYKWGQRFGHTLSVSMAMAAILKIPRPECTSWDGDPPSCEI